jgi:hypothetical protein
MLHRRPPSRSEERDEGLIREQEWEELRIAPPGLPAKERTRLDEPALPVREDVGGYESASPALTVQSELEVHDKTSVDLPLTEIQMTMVEDKQEVIEIEVETLLKPSTPLHLGGAEEVMVALAVHEVLAERVMPAAVPRRIWAQRLAGAQLPTYVVTNRVNPPDSAHYLGTATLVSQPAVDDGSQPNEEPPIVSAPEADEWLNPLELEAPREETDLGMSYALVPIRRTLPVSSGTALVVRKKSRDRGSSYAGPLFVMTAVLAAIVGLLLHQYPVNESAHTLRNR